MPKRGENIYLRRDGRWEGRYICGRRSDGRPKYRSIYGYSRESVSKRLSFLRRQHEVKLVLRCAVTFKDLTAGWLEHCRVNVKLSTYERYRILVERHIVPVLGRLLIRELTAEKLREYLEEKRSRGRLDGRGGLAPKTVNDIHVIIKSVIKYAVREFDYHVDRKLSDIRLPKRAAHKIEVFSENETGKITERILEKPDISGLGILLSLDTGLRLGEICALKWSDIDFDEQALSVRRTAIRINHGGSTTLEIQLPKTENSERKIPLTAHYLSLLKSCEDCHGTDEYIFSRKPDRPLEPRTMQYRFHRFLANLNIRIRGFHTLRHSFASRSVERGVDIKTLSEILGHSNVQTTLQMYTHPSIDTKRRSMELASVMA